MSYLKYLIKQLDVDRRVPANSMTFRLDLTLVTFDLTDGERVMLHCIIAHHAWAQVDLKTHSIHLTKKSHNLI